MAYGIEIKNTSGVVQIDETHLNFGLVASGSATCDTAVGGASRLYQTSVTVANLTYPVPALHTYGNGIAYVSKLVSGSNTTFYFVGGQNNTFDYYIFDAYPATTSTYGIEVKDSSGNVTFSSDYPPMDVRAFATGPIISGLPSGPVYAAAIVAPVYRETTLSELTYPDGSFPFTSYVKAVNTNATGAVSVDIVHETYATTTTGPTYTERATEKFAVIAIGGGTTSTGPTYSIETSTLSADEGDTVTFDIATTNVADSTVLYWTTTGPVVAADFSDATGSGSVTITSNAATLNRILAEDTITEGVESFQINLHTGSTTGPVVSTSNTVQINDTSLSPYSITEATGSVDEGSSVVFNVTTPNLQNGTSVYFSTTGPVAAADFTDTSLTGSNTVTSNATTFTRSITSDLTTEGSETFQLYLRTGSATGPIQATSGVVTINDTSVASDVTVTITIGETSSGTETWNGYTDADGDTWSNNTAIGSCSDTLDGDTIHGISTRFNDDKILDTWNVYVSIEGDHTSGWGYSTITFEDVSPARTLTFGTGTYNSSLDMTTWIWFSNSGASDLSAIYNYLDANVSSTTDVTFEV
jgi:hypothetical protein